MNLELDEPKRLLLKDILSVYLEQMEEARNRMIEDHRTPQMQDMDEFLEMMAIHGSNTERVQEMLEQLK